MRNQFHPIPRSRGKPWRFLWPSKAGPPWGVLHRTDPPDPDGHIPRLGRPPGRTGDTRKRLLWLSRAGPPPREIPPKCYNVSLLL